jgi:6,7-dimethyl-8-ribityllumazine synthase
VKSQKKKSASKKSKIKIVVVTSRFNEEITDKLLEGALQVLEDSDAEIFSIKVPGAVEIPLTIQTMLNQGCDAAVALGAVIRGETSHFDYVCNSVESGITQVMLQTGKPIAFGVLTTENEQQALDRVGGKHGHKGEEAAQVALEMVGLLRDLKSAKVKK